ncbi:MAG: cation:proton antiporter [Sandaracinus sp.]
MAELPPEVQYLLLVVGLFVGPRILQRAYIPNAVSCLALGAALGMGLGLFQHDTTLALLATLGIVSLFLFAGLEVDFSELRRGLRVVVQHLVVQSLLLAGVAWLLAWAFSLRPRAAVLMALALLTPSTGFILDALPGFGLSEDRAHWVKTKAIASEILALVVLFVTVQSADAAVFSVSSAAIASLVLVLPPLFRVFARYLLPHAPSSEFTFLVIVALLCAYLTRALGVYYLVGAFVVGVTALRMQREIPSLASPRLTHGVELFASFFIPFYFLKAGLHLEASDFTWQGLGLAVVFLLIMIPLRVGAVALHRRVSLGEPAAAGVRVGLALVPTLVFTIVLADILRERYELRPDLYGALIVVSLIDTALPGILLRTSFSAMVEPQIRTMETPADKRSHSADAAKTPMSSNPIPPGAGPIG